MDQRVVDFVGDKWCMFRLATSIAINQTTGVLAAFREHAPKANQWLHFLIVPRDVRRNQFWLLSREAQGGAGELVSQKSGLRQWRFEGGFGQCFEITPLPSSARDRMVRLTLVDDSSHVVSTRWSSPAFLWGLTPGHEQQMLHLEGAEAIAVPKLPEIDGTPGSMDRDMLKVESFEGDGVLDVTPPRVVAAQLVAFPFVKDTYPQGGRCPTPSPVIWVDWRGSPAKRRRSRHSITRTSRTSTASKNRAVSAPS